MKPRIRSDHPQPTLGKSCCSISGKITPPREPPAAAMPVALARRALNQCPRAETAGVKMREVPTPPRIPNVSIKCQYSRSFVSKTGSTSGKLPSRLTTRTAHQKRTQQQTHRPRHNNPPRPIGIKNRPNLHATKEAQKDVYAEHPADLAFAKVAELVGREVGLEDSYRVHVAEASRHAGEGAEDDEPGLQAAFGVGDFGFVGGVGGGGEGGFFVGFIVGGIVGWQDASQSDSLGVGGGSLVWIA